MPGTLPVPNKKAIEWTMWLGKALNCKIKNRFSFDRKHYFYPDLPKGYQITQYYEPIATDGWLEIIDPKDKRRKKCRIKEIHLEEDTAKLIHEGDHTLIDFNRAGVPLVEIVTEPDFDSSDVAKKFLEELQVIVRYLGISDADMEKGSMRLEPNISVKRIDEPGLPKYKVEVKNINSFNFVKKAIDFEIRRQISLLNKGEIPVQETRGFVERTGETMRQRVKEGAKDYRYFQEPDIPPFTFTYKEIQAILQELPELPSARLNRLVSRYGVKESDAYIITRDKNLADYFEKIIKDHRITSSEEKGLIAKLATLVVNKKIDLNLSPKEFVSKALEHFTMKKIDLSVLRSVVKEVMEANHSVVEKIKKGELGKINFLIGQVMKEMKGQADPRVVKETVEKML